MTQTLTARRCLTPLLLAPLLLATAIAPGALAQDDPLIDPEAAQRLRAMSDYLAGAETLHLVAFSFFDETEDSGIQIKRFMIHDVRLARPDRLAFTSTFDDGTVRQGWYVDGTLTVAAPEDGRYIVIDAGDSIDATLDMVEERYGYSLPLADILYSDVYAAQEPYMLSAAYLGERMIMNTALDHVSVESIGADWQVWMDAGDTPIPRRLVMQFVETDGQPEYMLTFHRVEIDPAFEPAVFEAQLGDDWERVEPQSMSE